jgi:Uncharacterized conserved protein
MKKNLIIAAILILIIILVILFRDDIAAAWYFASVTLNTPEKMRSFVMSFGYFAPLIFLVVQITQVIVAPIPGNVVTLVGGALFGVYLGTILSCIGILMGSVIAFYIARVFGKPLVIKLVGNQIYEKYGRVFNKKGVLVLFLIFLFPFFPDDALCLLAGLSQLPFTTFLLLITAGRLPGTITSVLVGSGALKLNMIQWIIVAAVSAVVLFVSIRYGSKIEDWLYRKLKLGRKAV